MYIRLNDGGGLTPEEAQAKARELHIEGLNGKCGRMEIELYEANLYAIGRKM